MTRKAFGCVGLAALPGLVLWSTLAYADPPIQAGNVVVLKGRSTVTRAAAPQPQEIPLKYRDDLFHEDRIRTMQLSLVKYLLASKGVVTVGENSVAIVRLPPGEGPTIVDLKSGKVALTVAPDGGGVEVKVGEVKIATSGNATDGSRFIVIKDTPSGPTKVSNLIGSAPVIITTGDGLTPQTLPGGHGLPIIGNTIGNQFTFSREQQNAFLENFKTTPAHGAEEGFTKKITSDHMRIAVTLADAVCRGIEGCPGLPQAFSELRTPIHLNIEKPPYLPPQGELPPRVPQAPPVVQNGGSIGSDSGGGSFFGRQ